MSQQRRTGRFFTSRGQQLPGKSQVSLLTGDSTSQLSPPPPALITLYCPERQSSEGPPSKELEATDAGGSVCSEQFSLATGCQSSPSFHVSFTGPTQCPVPGGPSVEGC